MNFPLDLNKQFNEHQVLLDVLEQAVAELKLTKGQKDLLKQRTIPALKALIAKLPELELKAKGDDPISRFNRTLMNKP